METLIQDSVIEDCEGKEEEFNAEGLEEKLCRNVLQVLNFTLKSHSLRGEEQ